MGRFKFFSPILWQCDTEHTKKDTHQDSQEKLCLLQHGNPTELPSKEHVYGAFDTCHHFKSTVISFCKASLGRFQLIHGFSF